MSLHELDPVDPRFEEYLGLRNVWIWLVVLGITLMAVGAVAIGAAVITTLTSAVIFGILLVGAGAIQLVNAFLARSWRGFLIHVFVGLLYLVVGGLMVEHPVQAAEGLTLLLAAALLLGGAVRVTFALIESFAGRGWMLLNGVISVLLGVMIWQQWPAASLWVIGLFIGIDLVFSGWMSLTLGLMAKGAAPASGHPGSRTPPSILPTMN
jgi:uncharacterized membrane protein HdeD (DUF308 family)